MFEKEIARLQEQQAKIDEFIFTALTNGIPMTALSEFAKAKQHIATSLFNLTEASKNAKH